MPPKVSDFLALAMNALEQRNLKTYIPDDRAPTEAQRGYLRQRAGDIDAAMRPASMERLNVLLGRLFAALTAPRGDDLEQKARAQMFREVLAGQVSEAALEHVVWAFIRGDMGDGTWIPQPAAVYQACKDFDRKWIAERQMCLRVADAEVLPAPKKAEYVEQVIDGVVTKARLIPEAARRNIEEIRRNAAAFAGREPDRPPTQQEALHWLKKEAMRLGQDIDIDALPNR